MKYLIISMLFLNGCASFNEYEKICVMDGPREVCEVRSRNFPNDPNLIR